MREGFLSLLFIALFLVSRIGLNKYKLNKWINAIMDSKAKKGHCQLLAMFLVLPDLNSPRLLGAPSKTRWRKKNCYLCQNKWLSNAVSLHLTLSFPPPH